MYIRKTTSKVKDKVYENYLLVESVMTPKGPRQSTICSLGHLKPRPKKEWLLLAQKVETALKGQLTFEKEKSLFELDDTIYFYDLTSTYFEGMCLLNPQAKRGYSRDKRSDCKQVLIGLVIDRDGFPEAHEIFPGNRKDSTTLDEMLDILEKRVGKREGATVVVDRGMAFEDNICQIKKKGYHYIVATRQAERKKYLDEFEEGNFHLLLRNTSSTNSRKKKSGVFIKKMEKGDELYVLCISDKTSEKDKAIREFHEKKLIADLKKLAKRISTGRLKKEEKIYQAMGRIKERYPRVARYYKIEYDSLTQELSYRENAEKKSIAETLDGSYMLRTDRTDISDDEIWRTYSLLSRCENAFRNMKSPLCERAIFHQLERRVQTHIFLSILAYHLLVAIEKTLSNKGIHTSWLTVKDTLKTHQLATVILPTTSGEVLKIRRGVNAEPKHLEIYKSLKIPSEVMKPINRWHSSNIVTERTGKLP